MTTTLAVRSVILEGQQSALELVLRDAPLASVLEQLVKTLEVSSDGQAMASILLTDGDAKELVMGVGPSLPKAYCRAIDGLPIGPDMGACGRAAFTKSTVIVRDTLTDPLCAAFRDLVEEHQLRACWSTPILSSHKTVLGTFALYYRVPTEPSARDREMVELLGKTAALAIERDVNQRLRERFEAQLRSVQAEQHAQVRASWRVVEALFEQAPAAIALVRGSNLVFELVNKRGVELWQRSSALDLLGKPLLIALPELNGQGFEPLLHGVMATGKAHVGNEVPVVIRKPGGENRTGIFNFVYAPIENEDGVTDGVGVFAFEVTDVVLARRALEKA